MGNVLQFYEHYGCTVCFVLECANDKLSVVQDIQIRNDTIVKMAVFVQNH